MSSEFLKKIKICAAKKIRGSGKMIHEKPQAKNLGTLSL
jgi:hypothetical protein